MKAKSYKFLGYSILLISVSTITQWCELPIGNTFLWWVLDSLVLYVFYKYSRSQARIRPVFIFLLCVAASFIYGAMLQAHNYWDWKLLVGNLMTFMLPLAVYVFSDPNLLSKVLNFWLKRAWIILLILLPFLYSDAFGRFLVPYSFLALFFSVLSRRYRMFVIIAYLITITLGHASRSDTLKFSVCLVLGIVCMIPFVKRIFFANIKRITILLWIIPIIFFTLGVTGTFNVFNMEEELGLEGKFMMQNDKGDDEMSALNDTRTFLYVEEINSAIKHNYVIHGRSMARGYDSVFFGESIAEQKGLKAGDISKGERGACETSILNVFNYFGLIGVIIYFGIFVSASYKAVTKSNNIYVPIVGEYVAFRWLFGWVEDFSKFDLNYLFIWIMIGICFSERYRTMTNQEFITWVKDTTRL